MLTGRRDMRKNQKNFYTEFPTKTDTKLKVLCYKGLIILRVTLGKWVNIHCLRLVRYSHPYLL